MPTRLNASVNVGGTAREALTFDADVLGGTPAITDRLGPTWLVATAPGA